MGKPWVYDSTWREGTRLRGESKCSRSEDMDTNKTDLHVYSIGHVMEKTGLSARQIRYYDQVGLISPQRTAGNQRRFSDRDIQRLLLIKDLIQKNLTTEAIKEILEGENIQDADYHTEEQRAKDRLTPKELTSLYPVLDSATLQRILQERRLSREEK